MMELNEVEQVRKKGLSTREICYVGLFAGLTTICSWFKIPTAVPFTMQTFAISTTLFLLGGKLGTLTIGVYLLMGAVGLPVFAGMTGGIGTLFGATGGYLLGFLVMGLFYWFVENCLFQMGKKKYLEKKLVNMMIMVVGLVLCYVLGTIWFVEVYLSQGNEITYGMALAWCVTPFVLPDLIKLSLAFVVADRLKAVIRKR